MRGVISALTVVLLLSSCKTYENFSTEGEKGITYQKEKYEQQRLLYYQYNSKSNVKLQTDNRKKTDLGNENSQKKDKSNLETNNHKKELIQTLESKGLKPCKFVEKVLNKQICSDSITNNIKDEPIKESKPKKGLLKDKDKEYRHWFWQGVFKIISSIYFIFLAITNFQLFTMIFPTSICLLACICYPIWSKKGYLNTPYAKIATFIAAYGGLFANILWIILYI